MSVSALQTGLNLDLVRDVTAILDQELALRESMGRVLDIILSALPAQAGGIASVSSDGHHMELVAHTGIDKGSLQESDIEGLVYEAEALEKPREISLDGQDCALARVLRVAGCHHALTVPLASRTRPQGCLFVGSTHAFALDERAQDALDALGRVIALGCAYAQLDEQMGHRTRESEALYNVSRAFMSTLDLTHLLNLVVHSAVDTIPTAKNCVLHLLEEETGELHPKAISFMGAVRQDVTGRSRMRIGQGVAGITLETGHVVNVPDVANDPRFIRVGKTRSFASMMVAPLRLGERRIGTLSIDSDRTHAFSASDERWVMTLATQAAVAIENARLVEDLQRSLHDLKATQKQLIQSEKLSAIGQLIAGVAHELNNPLTAVMGYTQLLQMSSTIDEAVRRDLEKIYAQAQRAAKIVQNLLTFARQHKAERQYVDINEMLQRTLELRMYQLRVENIDVVTELDDDTLGTLADPNQLQSVFLNLINNAQDAMTEYRRNGKLKVVTRRAGDNVRIEFADNGPGLTPEAKQHIFEPFFTTKEVGKGTGLGLSICFGIVSKQGGRIWAESEEGQGATFIIELPASEKPSDESIAQQDIEPPVVAAKGKFILVVDDEDDVGVFVRRALMQDGHRVLLARDGNTALDHVAKARERGTLFDLIISDVKMPGLSGPVLYERIRQVEPKLAKRMILTTGDTMSEDTQQFLQESALPYLVKPFEINKLRQLMMRVLASAEPLEVAGRK